MTIALDHVKALASQHPEEKRKSRLPPNVHRKLILMSYLSFSELFVVDLSELFVLSHDCAWMSAGISNLR
jgi:hypothetical protein